MAKFSPIIDIKILGDAKDAIKGFKEAEGAADGFGTKLGGIGKLAAAGLASAGAAAGAAFLVGLDGAMNAQALDRQLQGSLGLTADQASKYGDIAGKAYANNFGGSLEEAYGAVESVISQFPGIPVDTLQTSTQNALAVASTFGVDMQEVLNTVGISTDKFGGDFGSNLDLVTAALQKVPAAMRGDLLEATKEYLPFLEQVGISGDQAFGLLAQAAEQGPYVLDKVGDAWKEYGIRSIDGSKLSREAIESLGMNYDDFARRVAAGGDTAAQANQDVLKALTELEDPLAKNAAGVALFGTQWEDLGGNDALKVLNPMMAGLEGVEGAAQTLADTTGDTLQGRLESLKRKGIMALTDGVTKLLPYIEQAADWLSVKLPPAIAVAQAKFQEIVAWVQEHWPEIQAAIQPVIDTIVVIITSAVDIIQTLWANFGDNIMAYVERVWPYIQQTIEGVMNIIQGVIKTVTALIKGDWDGVWEGIRQTFEGVWQVIVGRLGQTIETIKFILGVGFEIIKSMISAPVEAAKGLVSDALDGIVGLFTYLPRKMRDEAGDLFGWIWDLFRDVLNELIGGWNKLRETFQLSIHWDPPGPGSINFDSGPILPYITPLAKGGITNGPMLSLIGDNPGGKEAVIPLDSAAGKKLLGDGPTLTIVVNGFVGSEAQLGRELQRLIDKNSKRNGRAA